VGIDLKIESDLIEVFKRLMNDLPIDEYLFVRRYVMLVCVLRRNEDTASEAFAFVGVSCDRGEASVTIAFRALRPTG
jgi:hypothetical protein